MLLTQYLQVLVPLLLHFCLKLVLLRCQLHLSGNGSPRRAAKPSGRHYMQGRSNKTFWPVQFWLYAQPYRGIVLTERYLPLCQILPDFVQVTEFSVLNLMNLSIKSAYAALSLSLHSIASSMVSVRQASSTCQIKVCTIFTLCR